MHIRLRFFASLREAVGTSEEKIELPIEVRTMGDVRNHLRSRGGVWEQALGEGKALCMACDQLMATSDTPVRDGCEVAFFPPVTGG